MKLKLKKKKQEISKSQLPSHKEFRKQFSDSSIASRIYAQKIWRNVLPERRFPRKIGFYDLLYLLSYRLEFLRHKELKKPMSLKFLKNYRNAMRLKLIKRNTVYRALSFGVERDTQLIKGESVMKKKDTKSKEVTKETPKWKDFAIKILLKEKFTLKEIEEKVTEKFGEGNYNIGRLRRELNRGNFGELGQPVELIQGTKKAEPKAKAKKAEPKTKTKKAKKAEPKKEKVEPKAKAKKKKFHKKKK